MLTLLATAALSFGGPQPLAFAAQDTQAAPATDANKILSAATAKLAGASSYSFTLSSETERIIDGVEGGGGAGGEARGGRGGFGGGGADQGPTTGTFKQGLPMLLQVGDTKAYKEGETIVHQDAEGAWQLFDMQSMRGGRGGGRGGDAGGGRGGDAGGGRGGDAGGGRGAQRGGFNRSLMGMLAVSAPHEMFADFASKTTSVEHSKKGESAFLTGMLSEEAATALGGRAGGRGGRGGAGGGGPQMTTTGTYELELKGDRIVSAKIIVTREGDFGERSIEMTTTRTFTFEGVGETELEVPDDVLAHFEI